MRLQNEKKKDKTKRLRGKILNKCKNDKDLWQNKNKKQQQQQTNKTINKQDVGPSFTINLD